MAILLVVPGCAILFLYMIFQSAKEKKTPFLPLLWILLFLGITALCAFFWATVRASYLGQDEWQQERQFFLNLFIQKLEESGDLQTAAVAMQSQEVAGQTKVCIQHIVQAFYPRTVLALSLGGVILLFSAASLWLKRINSKKYYPLLLLFFVLAGSTCFNTGIYYCKYAARTNYQLTHFLRLQQEYVMKDLAEIKTDVSISEIVKMAEAEAGRVNGYGYGQRLPQQLQAIQKKKNTDK